MSTANPAPEGKQDFFFSYSTAEPTNCLLATLLWIVFREEFNMRLTPSALTSDASQLAKIEKEISESAFGVVCLDGLRPNVVHEWGFMRGRNTPVILMKRDRATIDVRHFLRESAPEIPNPLLNVDAHLSNLKDINYASWFPDDPPKSAKVIWDEYEKIKNDRKDVVLTAVKEPRLW